MIDIVIPTYKNDLGLEKTLMSIYLQDIEVPYKVTIISNKINNDLIDKYNKIIPINYIETNEINNFKDISINNTNYPYIIFIEENDLFYNIETLNILYKIIILNNDSVIGYEMTTNDKPTYISDTIYWKLFDKEKLKNNNIINTYTFNDIICIKGKE